MQSNSKPSRGSKTSNNQPQFFTNMANSIRYLSSNALNASKPVMGLSSGTRDSLEFNHLPLPEEPPGLYDTLITDSDMALTKRKFVKVTSSGEVEMEPDSVEFCVKITTNKTDPPAAKESVRKRKDFVLT